MDLAAVLAQLNDVPATFRPAGNPYSQLTAARAGALSLFTDGADATTQQVLDFDGAIDGWIDLWGLLFGIPRNQGEGDVPYAARIVETVLAWVGTLPAIQVWIDLFAPGGSVAENPSGLGYALTLPGWMNAAQVRAFLVSLGRIRPAGVPFTLNQSQRPGLFLGAEAFLGDGADVGTYLTSGLGTTALGIGSTTCSAQPLIPDLFMVDPLLGRPGLLAAGAGGVWPIPTPMNAGVT